MNTAYGGLIFEYLKCFLNLFQVRYIFKKIKFQMPTFIKFYTTCFVQTVIFDLHNCRYRIQMETGHCFGSVQFRSGLSGASQPLMSV